MPTNAWIPSALVSFFFPGLGNLFFPVPDLRSKGIRLFVAYIIATWVVPIAITVVERITEIYALGYIGYPFHLIRLLFHVGGMIWTHDTACRLNPSLGSPIFFKS